MPATDASASASSAAAASSSLIAYHPFIDDRVEKGYTTRMREELAAFGTVVRFEGVWRTWIRRRRRLDWLVLNWTDNELLDRTARRVAVRKVVKLFARTLWMRLAARRLAFVRHNVYPHATAAGHEAAARRWVDRYEGLFDTVLVHSGDGEQLERSHARCYCPHPLYHRIVPQPVLPPWTSALPARFFVVFGRIVRYKRLERLIAHFPAGETLLVIGVTGDASYVDELVGCCPPNVWLRPGPLPEDEAQAIVGRSTALLMAHADPEIIVSSSFFFAMSLRVPVIAVATPFLRWITPRLGDDLVVLVEDVDELRARLPAFKRREASDGAAIDREFGDGALRTALCRAFTFPD